MTLNVSTGLLGSLLSVIFLEFLSSKVLGLEGSEVLSSLDISLAGLSLDVELVAISSSLFLSSSSLTSLSVVSFDNKAFLFFFVSLSSVVAA